VDQLYLHAFGMRLGPHADTSKREAQDVHQASPTATCFHSEKDSRAPHSEQLVSEPCCTSVYTQRFFDRYWSSGIINGLAVAGSIGWVIALLSAAVAATAPERRRLAAIAAVVIFVAGGWARTHLFTGAGGMSATPAWWLTTLASGLVMLVIAKPGVVTALLTLAALLFGAAHVPPTGPLGALCFLAAAVLLELDLARPLASRSSEGHPSRLEAPA